VPAADAAAVISRCSGACSTSFCSNSWSTDLHSISSCTGKPQGSRLSRSSSTGCNLQALASCSTTNMFSTSSLPDHCKPVAGPEGAGSGDRQCTTLPDSIAEQDRISQILADRDNNAVSEALHHKLSSPDRYASLETGYAGLGLYLLCEPKPNTKNPGHFILVYGMKHCTPGVSLATHPLLAACAQAN
jgi:hypothetical protein